MKGRNVPPAYSIQFTENVGYQVVWSSGEVVTPLGYPTKREALAAALPAIKEVSK